jgi:hypothetical protein
MMVMMSKVSLEVMTLTVGVGGVVTDRFNLKVMNHLATGLVQLDRLVDRVAMQQHLGGRGHQVGGMVAMVHLMDRVLLMDMMDREVGDVQEVEGILMIQVLMIQGTSIIAAVMMEAI